MKEVIYGLEGRKITDMLPAGWYDSEQVGAHEYQHIHTHYLGNDPDYCPKGFEYWQDEMPVGECIIN